MKFADRAKSVFSKIKPNEILAADQDLIKRLTDEINNLKQILSIRKRRGNYGEVENQFIRLKEENEKLKQSFFNSEEIEKLIYENRVLKLELQKLKSKNDFFVESKSFEGNNNMDKPALESNNFGNPTPSVKSVNDNPKNENYANQEIRYGNTLKGLNENMNEMVPGNYNDNNLNSDFIINKNSILGSPDKNLNNSIKNSPQNKIIEFNNSNNFKNHNNLENNVLMKHNLNSSYNINDMINNLMLNNKSDSISELSLKKNTFSYKDTISENNPSNKKLSAYNSLFKAGESLIGGHYSSLHKNIGLDRKHRTPHVIALKQVNDRLKYLENLEKESSKLLNKQREKIKFEKIRKEEEMKKKIEDVFNYQ